MRKTLTALALLGAAAAAAQEAGFVHPLAFGGSSAEKAAVIAYIQATVEQDYSAIGMGDPATLRMMEREELKAFKQLTQATEPELLDEVIRSYCEIGMCNYNTLWMMYQEQVQAAGERLRW